MMSSALLVLHAILALQVAFGSTADLSVWMSMAV